MPKLKEAIANVSMGAYTRYKKKAVDNNKNYLGFSDWKENLTNPNKVTKEDVGTESGYRKARRLAQKRS